LFAKGYIYPEPYGLALIIAPWNYPFQLMLSPLVGAMAAGNCAILKPSEVSPHSSRAINEIISNNFDSSYISVIEGGIEESQALLAEKFDYIFYTGSTNVGKIVMSAAAQHLTPVTLELGGKSPCIAEPELNIDIAAKRIIWGKYFNAGQTCIAPDYLLVNKSIKARLIARIKEYIAEFYGEEPALSPHYARIINERHFDRISGLMDEGEIIAGGQTDRDERYIAPTVIDEITLTSKIMQEEIFGPILPILEYEDLQEAVNIINSKPKPLALYLFTNDKKKQEKVLKETSSGGVCINDTIFHLTPPDLPFGGVGDSGMGCYHGKYSFNTFTHNKSAFKQTVLYDLKFRYPPYLQGLRIYRLALKLLR